MRAFWCGHVEPNTQSQSQSHCSTQYTTTRLRQGGGVVKSGHERSNVLQLPTLSYVLLLCGQNNLVYNVPFVTLIGTSAK
jgi:hypothetical protein